MESRSSTAPGTTWRRRNGLVATYSFPRSNRLSSVIREALADEIERLADPRLELVTITDVEVGSDLTLAQVYFATHDEASLEDARAALVAASRRLRKLLGTELRIKRIPALRFLPDRSIFQGARIDEVIRNWRVDEGDGSDEEAQQVRQ